MANILHQMTLKFGMQIQETILQRMIPLKELIEFSGRRMGNILWPLKIDGLEIAMELLRCGMRQNKLVRIA
jgi:hypothetical protein